MFSVDKMLLTRSDKVYVLKRRFGICFQTKNGMRLLSIFFNESRLLAILLEIISSKNGNNLLVVVCTLIDPSPVKWIPLFSDWVTYFLILVTPVESGDLFSSWGSFIVFDGSSASKISVVENEHHCLFCKGLRLFIQQR